MFIRTLKTNVIVSLLILLLIGMILIDFVVVRTIQRDLIREKLSQAVSSIYLLEDALRSDLSEDGHGYSREVRSRLAYVLSDHESLLILIMGTDKRVVYSAGKSPDLRDELEKQMQNAIATGKRQVNYSESAWGVFWFQHKYLLVSSPVKTSADAIGSIGIVVTLENIYQQQRKSQRFIFIYLVINTLLLTFLGFHRLFKVFLQPIERLAKRAEDYQTTDDSFFPVRKQDNELKLLSQALNRMTRRITEDKTRLESAVHSLESTNIELKKAQEEIIRAEKLASVGRLSSGIAHEIGNPIGIIMGYLDLLKQEELQADEKRGYIERAEKEISRMDTVIRQLLDLARPSAALPKQVSVHAVIEDMADVLNVQPLMSKVQLVLSLKAALDTIMADPNLLRQVFLNLAINAADAVAMKESQEKGRLVISTEIAPPGPFTDEKPLQNIAIMFEDNGPGIPAEHLGSIFDPFFTTKEPGQGTGLGLSVCIMIVESMGGTIKAESREGQGTSMRILLPLSESVTQPG